jgi:hypothetical protein
MPLSKTQTGKFNFKCCHIHYMDPFHTDLSHSLNMLFQNQNLCPLAHCYLITKKFEKLPLGSH